jgi:putative peptidoglycan lipid II flippase
MGSSEDAARYPEDGSLSTGGLSGVARSAGVVGGATLASRVLGLVRDVILANTFAAAATDTFFIAFMIPNLFRRLVGEGSLTVSFVPIFTGWLQRSREEARRVFNAAWTLGAGVGLLITIGGILLAGPLVHLFAPGFSLEPGKHELCVTLLRLCFPYILFLILVAVAMGALNAVGHFLAPAIAPVLLNLCLIAAALAASPFFATPILSLGVAVVLAGILQCAIQVPPLRARGLTPQPVIAPGHPAMRRLGVLMAPAVLGASVFQLNVLVSRLLSSFEGDGAVSYLYYAGRLIEFPLGVFVVAIGTASLPTFSRLAKTQDRPGLSQAFSGALGLALALALPSTLGLLLLREPIFATLFSWNREVFGEAAVVGCAEALFFYALGLVPITVSRIYVNLCFAHENTRTPARAAVVSLIVNVLASLALIGPLPWGPLPARFVALQHAWTVADMGFAGLALAASIASLANAIYLVVATHRLYGGLLGRGALGRWLRLGVAGVALAGAVWGLQQILPIPRRASSLGLALLALHVAVGAGVYLASLYGLRSPELAALRATFRRRSALRRGS